MHEFKQHFQTIGKTPASDGLEEFLLLNGRYSNFTKETFFLRYAGGDRLEEDTARLRVWAEQGKAQRAGHVFVSALASQPPAAQIDRYVSLYGGGAVRFPFRFENRMWQDALEQSFQMILEQFKRVRGRSEESIVKNFAVKILFWIDTYFPQLFLETVKMNRFPKFSCGGDIRTTEYLFLYLLFLLGCDVLYISRTGAVSMEDEFLLGASVRLEGKRDAAPVRSGRAPERTEAPNGRAVISMSSIRRPERHTAPAPVSPPVSAPSRPGPVPRPVHSSAGRESARQPMEFEELAKCASSVVMLKVFDGNDQCFKSGSGVIISDKGYVLTNLHVVNGGRYYGILLEEETDIFYTNELIKYHQDYDLAVLRMEKHRSPIPISRSQKGLVRGQKVVAIGSPLGLFNSVSDGIISGFRNMGAASMIQFTAPVSHGSSGGALLDLYGDLIGLITAGFDDGQNLNLAVDYQTILQFVRGLI